MLLATFADEIYRHTSSGGEAIVRIGDAVAPAHRVEDFNASIRNRYADALDVAATFAHIDAAEATGITAQSDETAAYL